MGVVSLGVRCRSRVSRRRGSSAESRGWCHDTGSPCGSPSTLAGAEAKRRSHCWTSFDDSGARCGAKRREFAKGSIVALGVPRGPPSGQCRRNTSYHARSVVNSRRAEKTRSWQCRSALWTGPLTLVRIRRFGPTRSPLLAQRLGARDTRRDVVRRRYRSGFLRPSLDMRGHREDCGSDPIVTFA